MTLIFDFHKGSCTHLVNCIYQLSHHRLQLFMKIPLFYRFPIHKHEGPNLPCRKIDQRQPRVIIGKNLVVLKHPMLHTKFQGQPPFGSGEEDF